MLVTSSYRGAIRQKKLSRHGRPLRAAIEVITPPRSMSVSVPIKPPSAPIASPRRATPCTAGARAAFHQAFGRRYQRCRFAVAPRFRSHKPRHDAAISLDGAAITVTPTRAGKPPARADKTRHILLRLSSRRQRRDYGDGFKIDRQPGRM